MLLLGGVRHSEATRMQRAHRITVPMQVMMVARRAAKVIAGKLGAYVPYDLHLYEAIRNLHHWTPADVIFDVGANDGRTVSRLMRHLPSARTFAFEPVSSTFETLTEQTSEFSNVRPFKLALGSEHGTRTMYLSERSVLNSLYPQWSDFQATEEIAVTTVDRFVEEHELEQIHLLKIDAEGHDLEVLKGAREALRDSRVAMIQVEAGFETPGWRSMPSLHDFQSYLRGFGYYLYGIYNQCRAPLPHSPAGFDRRQDVLVFCDALFVHEAPRKQEAAQ